jgi:acetylornithine/N-succinyldiaminopimelate aminotransferase
MLYGYMNFGITPDIVSTAKGLGGGLPIGATMFSEKTCDVYTPGSHGSTFGGNPVCAAGALNVLSRIDDNLLADVRRKSEYIINELSPFVKSITGMGLMLGIETEKDAKEIINKCMEKGVLVISAKTKVRLLPPLSITDQQLEKAINILKEVITE